MELYFLGTGAGMPSRERNVTSIVLTLYEERGTFWMFDCGEGTQQQVLRSPLKLSKLEKLFVSHLHGDHIYGLPGLLTSRSYQGGVQPLDLYGPKGIREFIESTLRLSQARLDYDLNIVEFTEGVLFEDDQARVETALLDHRMECYGFRITEHDVPGKLFHEKLIAEGVKPGPVYARLKRGEDVTLEDGRTLKSKDYVDEPIKGRIVAILGDTRPCEGARRLAADADVLVHEATFGSDLEQMARQYYHSTTRQAAELAVACRVGRLILTHFSSRYRLEDMAKLADEVRELHPNTYFAQDHGSFSIPRLTRRTS